MGASPNLADARVYALVRRLYYRCFTLRVDAMGIERDDGFQEICLGLVTRSLGRSAWDPRRGLSLATWCWRSMDCITKNMADSARRKRWLQVGSGNDAAESSSAVANDPLTARELEDLAAQMEIPLAVVHALALGGDPFLAALDVGMPPREAMGLLTSLGAR